MPGGFPDPFRGKPDDPRFQAPPNRTRMSSCRTLGSTQSPISPSDDFVRAQLALTNAVRTFFKVGDEPKTVFRDDLLAVALFRPRPSAGDHEPVLLQGVFRRLHDHDQWRVVRLGRGPTWQPYESEGSAQGVLVEEVASDFESGQRSASVVFTREDGRRYLATWDTRPLTGSRPA